MLLAVAAAVLLVLLVDGRELANPLLIVVLSASALAGLGAWAGDHARARRHAALDECRRGEMAARAKQVELDKAEQAELEKIRAGSRRSARRSPASASCACAPSVPARPSVSGAASCAIRW